MTLLGRNGVGKDYHDSLHRRIRAPRRGTIVYKDKDISGRPAYEIAKQGIGIVPQGRRIFGSLTVLENLTLGMERGGGGWDLDRVYELFPRLLDRKRQRAKTLSGGGAVHAVHCTRVDDQP